MVESVRWSRRVACEDHAGRARYVEVFLTEKDDVALFVPAGEVAVIKPAQIWEFRQAVDDANVEAIARRIGP